MALIDKEEETKQSKKISVVGLPAIQEYFSDFKKLPKIDEHEEVLINNY